MECSNSVSLHFLAKQAKTRLREKQKLGYRGFTAIRRANSGAYEEMLYRKVVDILESEDQVLNPLDCLLDHKQMEIADSSTRQRYVLEASHMFIRMKERYRREHSHSCPQVEND